jgi:hypothetical protein
MSKLSLRKTSLYLLAAACSCIVLFWAVSRRHEEVIPLVPEANYSIPRQIRYGFTLQNTTNQLLRNAEFWTYAPVKQTPTQRCVRIETSHTYELISDDLGNQILHFRFDNLSPYATKIITIKADLKLSNTPNHTVLKDPQSFLQAEKYVETDAPELLRLAGKLKKQEPVKTAENIFCWVAEHVQNTGYLPNERGALYALRKKQGDCTEFMYLFAALCRANGIPARGMGGYVCRESTILRPGSYHNWAEFYDGGAWRIADPHRKVFMKNQSNYISMKVIGEAQDNPMEKYHRFRFAGDGLKVKMNTD